MALWAILTTTYMVAWGGWDAGLVVQEEKLTRLTIHTHQNPIMAAILNEAKLRGTEEGGAFADDFVQFLNEAVTAFHAVEAMKS